MQQKIIYILALIIVISVLLVLFRPIKSSAPNTETKTQTTYSPGQTELHYKQGIPSITTKTKSFHSSAILTSSAADSSYTYTNSDTTYNLSINIKPSADGNLLLDYFLDLTSKDLIRIDTIYQLRIDTLKIKQTITEIIEPPFYNTFLFGAVVTSSIILLLTILIR